jgi:hypothetical protein
MKEIIKEGKKPKIFSCKACFIKFKTDEYERVSSGISGFYKIVTTCPKCQGECSSSI